MDQLKAIKNKKEEKTMPLDNMIDIINIRWDLINHLSEIGSEASQSYVDEIKKTIQELEEQEKILDQRISKNKNLNVKSNENFINSKDDKISIPQDNTRVTKAEIVNPPSQYVADAIKDSEDKWKNPFTRDYLIGKNKKEQKEYEKKQKREEEERRKLIKEQEAEKAANQKRLKEQQEAEKKAHQKQIKETIQKENEARDLNIKEELKNADKEAEIQKELTKEKNEEYEVDTANYITGLSQKQIAYANHVKSISPNRNAPVLAPQKFVAAGGSAPSYLLPSEYSDPLTSKQNDTVDSSQPVEEQEKTVEQLNALYKKDAANFSEAQTEKGNLLQQFTAILIDQPEELQSTFGKISDMLGVDIGKMAGTLGKVSI